MTAKQSQTTGTKSRKRTTKAQPKAVDQSILDALKALADSGLSPEQLASAFQAVNAEPEALATDFVGETTALSPTAQGRSVKHEVLLKADDGQALRAWIYVPVTYGDLPKGVKADTDVSEVSSDSYGVRLEVTCKVVTK